uniref:Uncharacterized protein n=1 Tax=Anguilla anguilla TaxID=7936 RepID=A0A0E9V478_ANGAN
MIRQILSAYLTKYYYCT